MKEYNPQTLYQYLDLTYLGDEEINATESILRAQSMSPAAICISPQFVALAKRLTNIPIASVVNFPRGNEPTDTIKTQIKSLVKNGVDEIDFVFPYHHCLRGDENKALEITRLILSAIPPHIITKAIIETGELKDQDIIKNICLILIPLEIGFIKTSTGKAKQGADLTSASTILSCIKHSSVGFKVSGGIRTADDAFNYLHLTEKILQLSPVSSNRFRIGASNLTLR